MMPENFHIIVEGDEDLRFLKGYLGFLLGSSIPGECFKNLKGWGNLGGYAKRMRRALKEGAKVLIILDANSGYRNRRQEAQRILGEYMPGGRDLPLFLFPDNQSDGALENLLQQIIIPEHEGIFTCFEDYKKCLKECGHDYTPPDMKGKIYAYKEALGAKEEDRQFDARYWNFDHPALNPLKKFLTGHIE